MSDSTLERTARPRRSRTRSRTVNARPALVLSTLKPNQYDLRPACTSLVCPDCGTWVPITGLGTKAPKVVPHDTGRALQAPAVRCRLGSNRLITVDVTVRSWQERLEDGHAETGHRRKTTVRRKPKVAPALAVSQIAARVAASEDGGRLLWMVRKEQWAATEKRVRDADARRAQLPGGDAPLGAPPVPLTTLHPQRRRTS
ncbi:hypothetical protein [Streptomyces daghestanicus]|uniref:Uncharacterized protein n=1 Tax=Streptomyces daghestanicus TaxID=66885 RepID=A0ABQ3Q7I2_9ACTN|nr:hypothetical protein [Streptomyces daghestanicus]GGU66400.1 hypothetical protein GCM10010259_65850 [Streptomyces daghestanicus]GHI33231.1 hypothetical protein Sdagh_49610 [Streptomyces daghestanicus]